MAPADAVGFPAREQSCVKALDGRHRFQQDAKMRKRQVDILLVNHDLGIVGRDVANDLCFQHGPKAG